MGDGLRRATLEALCSRGPWQCSDGIVFPSDVREVYDYIERGEDFRGFCSPFAEQRVLELLLGNRLVVRHPGGRWEVSDG